MTTICCARKCVKFSDIPVQFSIGDVTHSGAFENQLQRLNTQQNVISHRPLVSHRKFGFFVVFVKKIIRKFTKFYVEPIVSSQNEINKLNISCLQDLYLDIELLRLKIEHLENENQQLLRRFKSLK